MGIIDALAENNQPETSFNALAQLVDKTIGVKLFTISFIDREKQVATRCYTNMPDAYPVKGEKPLMQNSWSEQVEERQETFVANSIEDIAEVFSDYELIQSLGCESCLNLPIVVDGAVLGTLNCLHDAGHYTQERVDAAQTLKSDGALALLLFKTLR